MSDPARTTDDTIRQQLRETVMLALSYGAGNAVDKKESALREVWAALSSQPAPPTQGLPPMPKCWSDSGHCINSGACNANGDCIHQPAPQPAETKEPTFTREQVIKALDYMFRVDTVRVLERLGLTDQEVDDAIR